MVLDPVKNFIKVIVNGYYNNSATEITLTSGEGNKLPNPTTDGAFNLVWWDSTNYSDPADDPNVEIVRCIAKSGDVITVARGQEGTSATNKNTSGSTYKMILALTKKIIDDIKTNLAKTLKTITFALAINTDATVGTNKTNVIVIPKPGTIIKAYAYAKTAPSGADLIFDINKNGTSIWDINQNNRRKIQAGQNSGTQTSFDTTSVSEGDLITIDIDQVGSSVAGKDITVELIILINNI